VHGIGTRHRQRLENPEAAAPWYYPYLSADLLSVYKNVFTGDSNIPEPKRLLGKANEAVQIAISSQPRTLPAHLTIPTSLKIDNLYAQMYPSKGKAHPHVDAYLTWVVSISFGAACDFSFGEKKTEMNTTVKLNAGDVAIFNGGKLFHSVSKICEETMPSYWKDREVETFGLARCNIQCRDRGTVDPNTPDSWRKLYEIA